MEPIIRAEKLEKTYREDGNEVRALDGIDLVIRAGEFAAVVGPSGSGKTTFLNVVSGLDSPDGGKVWLGEKLLSAMTGAELSDFRRDNIGFIFQAYNLIPVLTVEENIEFIMLLQGVPKEDRKQRVRDILNDVGLAGMEKRLPTRLSGGQQQRVAIARAMVSRPQLVLADEPTANVDSKTGAALVELMADLNKKSGMTFLFSTHDRMVMERARRVITLKDGRVESDVPVNPE